MPEDPLVNSPLFGMTTPVVTPVVAIPVESIETRVVAHDLPFHDTKGYVDHAIDEVSDLIEGIDAEDAKTLAAENEHRRQKEYFAGLEIADEISHQKHLEERSHAEKMKKYFEKEQGAVAKKNEEKEVVTA